MQEAARSPRCSAPTEPPALGRRRQPGLPRPPRGRQRPAAELRGPGRPVARGSRGRWPAAEAGAQGRSANPRGLKNEAQSAPPALSNRDDKAAAEQNEERGLKRGPTCRKLGSTRDRPSRCCSGTSQARGFPSPLPGGQRIRRVTEAQPMRWRRRGPRGPTPIPKAAVLGGRRARRRESALPGEPSVRGPARLSGDPARPPAPPPPSTGRKITIHFTAVVGSRTRNIRALPAFQKSPLLV